MIDQSTPVGVGPNSYSFYSYCWGYDACCPETAGVPVDFEGRRASSTIHRKRREGVRLDRGKRADSTTKRRGALTRLKQKVSYLLYIRNFAFQVGV